MPPYKRYRLDQTPKTSEEIEANKTVRRGFTREQLESWGVAWPPTRGWKRELLRRNSEASKTKALNHFADKGRNNPTPSETALHVALSEVLPRYGIEFRFQHVAGSYILDFAIPKKRVAIEVDGIYHFFQGRKDGYRTKQLKKRGWRVLRFTNYAVETDMPAVIVEILGACGCDSQNLFQL